MTEQPQSCDILLRDGVVVTQDEERRIIDPGMVAVTGNRIVAVAPAAEASRWRAARTVHCRGKAVLPGMVDCHTHLFQGLARGLGEGLQLWDWLRGFMWPYALGISREEARIAAFLGAIEAVRSGVTCVVDNHYAPRDVETTMDVAAAMEAVGLRGAVARGMFGLPTEATRRRGLPSEFFRHTGDEELEMTRECIGRLPAGSTIEIWPAPVNLVNAEQELVTRSVELARELGVPWHTHCSESKSDPDLYEEVYGIRPVEWLSSEGLLEDATLAHGIWLSDREIELVGEASAAVAHNPVSNQYLASGVMRLGSLREAGAVVGLGTDGPGAGHRQDPFEVMKAAVLLQRVASMDPTVASADLALELATREGARYAKVDSGVLTPGKLADIVVVGLERAHLSPLHDVVSTLVYSVRGGDVEATIVDGEIVYEDGRCRRVDEAEIRTEAQARAEELLARVGGRPVPGGSSKR